MTKSATDAPDTNRRGFLKLASLGSVAAAGAAIVSADDAEAQPATDAPTGGYRETDHVKTYYDLARF